MATKTVKPADKRVTLTAAIPFRVLEQVAQEARRRDVSVSRIVSEILAGYFEQSARSGRIATVTADQQAEVANIKE